MTTDSLNEGRLKKLLINLERKYNDNQKLRIKYFEEPTKFASSETELYAVLDELQGVTTQPELYSTLVSKNGLTLLLSMMTHDNTDIYGKVVAILQEMTDVDDDVDQGLYEDVLKALKKENIVEMIVTNLNRLNAEAKDESSAINNSLAVIDNLIDYDAQFADAKSKPLMDWMIRQMQDNLEFNAIKLAVSELMSVLLMTNSEYKLLFGELNGFDVLLQQVAYYRRVEPMTSEEHEFLEQIINCLCIAVMYCDQNRELFYKEEGVDLVELILREKREAVKRSNIKISMLKLLNHVLTSDKNHDDIVTKCCEKFVQVLGLRVLCPIFMQPKLILNPKIKRREYHVVINEIEEHTATIFLSLLKHSQDPEIIQRILIKFSESNFEKLQRLVDLHAKYFKIVATQDSLDGEDQAQSSSLFTLRTVDYLLLLIIYFSDHYEIYDFKSGETFTNRMQELLARKPEIKHQVLLEARKHMDEVSESQEEHESLKLVVEHLEQLAVKKK